jgi:hypothetical protein
MLEFLLGLPLFMAYLFGSLLTLLLIVKQRTVSSVMGFLGFFLLLVVRSVLPLVDLFTLRLHTRGMPLPRVTAATILASLAINLASAVAVLFIVGAIALAARNERRF